MTKRRQVKLFESQLPLIWEQYLVTSALCDCWHSTESSWSPSVRRPMKKPRVRSLAERQDPVCRGYWDHLRTCDGCLGNLEINWSVSSSFIPEQFSYGTKTISSFLVQKYIRTLKIFQKCLAITLRVGLHLPPPQPPQYFGTCSPVAREEGQGPGNYLILRQCHQWWPGLWVWFSHVVAGQIIM